MTRVAAAVSDVGSRDGEQNGPSAPRRWLRALWSAAVAGIAVIAGLAPHVLHHVAPLLGVALVSGAGGTVLFGALGLAASAPFCSGHAGGSAVGERRPSGSAFSS